MLMTLTVGVQGIGQSEYVAASTAFAHDLPVFLALPCFELPGVVCFGIIWERPLGGGT